MRSVSKHQKFYEGDVVFVPELGTFTKVSRTCWKSLFDDVMWEMTLQDNTEGVKLWHPDFTTSEGYIVVFVGRRI